MEFGLFYRLEVHPEAGKSEPQVFEEALDQWALADRVGFAGLWVVEHHFMPEYSHIPAPEVFLGAASQRTRRCRLGTGVILAPFHHPVNVAERTAVLDILSQGRLDVGIGRGFQTREYEAYGLDMENSREMQMESMDIIRRAWTQPDLTHTGRFWKIPRKISVLPRPLQRPHPPFWLAGVTPETFETAARAGAGCLAGPFKPMGLIEEDLRRYRQALPQDGEERFALVIGLQVARRGEQARAAARQAMERYLHLLRGFTAPLVAHTPRSYRYHQGVLASIAGRWGPGELEAQGMLIGGDPRHVIAEIEKLRRLGFHRLIAVAPAGALPREEMEESIELMGEEVIPHFAERNP